jgi:hypothetical protein
VFLKKILSVFLLLLWGAVFNSICAAAPLMIEKNLFSNDRKPPPPESADASQKPAKPGMALANIQLDGVMIQSNSKKAVLRMKTQPAGAADKKGQPASPFVTVREGQIVSDYRVSKIESKSILLEKDGQTFTIDLIAANKVVTPPAPSPPPAPVEQPAAAPGVAPQEAGAGQPPGVQPPPVFNPQNPPQPIPGQAAPTPRRAGVAGLPGQNRNQQNVYGAPPEPVLNNPNQPAETNEEEE